MRQREDWRQPAHRPGDCVAGVPEEILDRYAKEGPALERRGELPPVPEPHSKTSRTAKPTNVIGDSVPLLDFSGAPHGGSHKLLPEWNSQARIVRC
jgi:hypothetical protein